MSGAGTELSRLIPKWALQFKDETCTPCKDMAAKMDKWGVDGCVERHAAIVNHLVQQSGQLVPLFKTVPEACKRAAAIMLLNQAIKLASKGLKR